MIYLNPHRYPVLQISATKAWINIAIASINTYVHPVSVMLRATKQGAEFIQLDS